MFCYKCGSEFTPGEKFCAKCGAPLGSMAESENSRTTMISDRVKIVSEGQASARTNTPAVPTGEDDKNNHPMIILAVCLFAICVAGIITLYYYRGRTADAQPDMASEVIEPDSIEEYEEDSLPRDSINENNSVTEPAEVHSATNHAINNLAASSELQADGYDYSVGNLIDGDKSTAWVEGVAGTGIGESVRFEYEPSQAYMFSGITIFNGYQKSDDIYYKNARIKTVKIESDRGDVMVVGVDDMQGAQDIDFEHPFTANTITVSIESVYEGNKYQDTCISEMSFY